MNEEEKFSFETLDKIDFLPYLEKLSDESHEIWDLIDLVEKDYDNTDLTNNPIHEGSLFNWISSEEFGDYLEERYKGRFRARELVKVVFDFE